MQIPCVQNRVGCGCIVLLLIIICVSYGYLLNVNVCFSPPSFGRQFGGRRGCECITLEPSEMIVVSNVFNTHTHKHTDTRTHARARAHTHAHTRVHHGVPPPVFLSSLQQGSGSFFPISSQRMSRWHNGSQVISDLSKEIESSLYSVRPIPALVQKYNARHFSMTNPIKVQFNFYMQF